MNHINANNESKMGRHMKTIQRRINVAKALAEGQCGGNYYDACILISSIISGIAADIWPGRDIDKKRFIEVWVRYADSSLEPNPLFISIPLLVGWLEEAGKNSEANRIKAEYPRIFGNGYQCRRLISADLDMSEEDLVKLCPLELRDMRTYSYPAVFYEHVRNNLIHEYDLSEMATAWSHIDDEGNDNVGIDYANIMDNKEPYKEWRQIHFRIPWLLKVVYSIASNTLSLSKSTPLQLPRLWWVDGGKVKGKEGK